MRSRIFSSKYIKTISKGQIWIPAFLTLGFLLAFPVTGLVKLGSWYNLEYTADQISALYNNLWKDGFMLSGMLIAVIAAFMNSVNGFIYLYSKKKTDFYHGLPVKRSEMFWGRIVTGLVYYLVPYVIMEFLMICIGAARGFFSMKIMLMAVKMLCLHLLIYFVIYFSIVLIICVTGNLLMGALCLGGMYLYGVALTLLLSCYGSTFLYTFSDRKQYGVFAFLTQYASPGALVIELELNYASGNCAKVLLAVVILGIVLAALSWIAYKRRPSEAAGKSMVYQWIAVLVKFMVVVPAGLGIGWIFYSITVGRARVIWWIFGLLLGATVVHGLIETIYQMSFQGFFARKIQLILAVALIAVCAVIYQKDLLHFDSYVPAQENLASVNINMNAFDADYYSVYTETDGKFDVFDKNSWDDARLALSNEEGVGDQTYQAIEEIVKNNQADQRERDNYSYYIEIKYTLRSGRVVYRAYWVEAELLGKLMKGLYEEENLTEQKFSFLNLDPEFLQDVSLTDVTGNGYSIFQNDSEKKKQLLEAVRKDVEAASTEDFMETPEIKVDFSYQLPGSYTVNELVPGRENTRKMYADWILGIYPSFKNTLAILKETGYPLTIEELNIKKVILNYYNEDTLGEQVVYEDPDEIRQLKDDFVSMYGISNEASEAIADIGISIYTDQGEIMAPFELKKSNLPDFVQEKLDELGIVPGDVMVDEPVSMEETAYTEDYDVSEAVIGGADEETSISLESGDTASESAE